MTSIGNIFVKSLIDDFDTPPNQKVPNCPEIYQFHKIYKKNPSKISKLIKYIKIYQIFKNPSKSNNSSWNPSRSCLLGFGPLSLGPVSRRTGHVKNWPFDSRFKVKNTNWWWSNLSELNIQSGKVWVSVFSQLCDNTVKRRSQSWLNFKSRRDFSREMSGFNFRVSVSYVKLMF